VKPGPPISAAPGGADRMRKSSNWQGVQRFHLNATLRFSADKATPVQSGSSRCCSTASRGRRDCPDKRWIWQLAWSCRPDFADGRGRVQAKEPSATTRARHRRENPVFTAISDWRLQVVQNRRANRSAQSRTRISTRAPQGRLNLRTVRTPVWRRGDPWQYHGCVSGCCRARSGSGCRSAG
jgi:hypothetical protein